MQIGTPPQLSQLVDSADKAKTVRTQTSRISIEPSLVGSSWRPCQDGMLQVTWAESVQISVVRHVAEGLRTTRIGLADVGPWTGHLTLEFPEMFSSSTLPSPRYLSVAPFLRSLEGPVWVTGPCLATVRVLGMRSTELVHETGDHTVEVNAGIATRHAPSQ